MGCSPCWICPLVPVPLVVPCRACNFALWGSSSQPARQLSVALPVQYKGRRLQLLVFHWPVSERKPTFTPFIAVSNAHSNWRPLVRIIAIPPRCCPVSAGQHHTQTAWCNLDCSLSPCSSTCTRTRTLLNKLFCSTYCLGQFIRP